MTAITAYELIKGADWFKITPAVVRWLWKFGEEQAVEQKYQQQAFGFWLGEEHPVYQVYGEYMPRIQVVICLVHPRARPGEVLTDDFACT